MTRDEHAALKRQVAGWAMLAAFVQGRFEDAQKASAYLKRTRPRA